MYWKQQQNIWKKKQFKHEKQHTQNKNTLMLKT